MNKKKAYYSVFVFLLLSLNILFAYLYFFYFNLSCNLLFLITLAFFIVGILCLLLLIKKLFNWVYLKLYPLVDEASKVTFVEPVSARRAYKSLKVTIIILLTASLILQALNFVVD